MGPCAKDVMQTAPRTVSPELSLPELEEAFVSARVTGFPVVKDDVLVGVVARSDRVRRLVAERSIEGYVSSYYVDLSGFDPDARYETVAELAARTGARVEGLQVADLMTTATVTASPETPIRDVAAIMRDRHVHRLPITQAGRLVGILTSLDLVALVADGRLGPT